MRRMKKVAWGLVHIDREAIEEEKNRKCDSNKCDCKLNVTHARRVNMVYQVGADIDNLPLMTPISQIATLGLYSIFAISNRKEKHWKSGTK